MNDPRKKTKDARRNSLSIVTTAFLNDRVFIKKFLTRFLSNQQDIEDVAQEAYLHAFAAEQKKDGEIEQPRAFLFRIAKNIAISRLRRKSHQITEYIEDLGAPIVIQDGADPELEMEAQQTLGLYCEAVASLPEKCRQAFLLRKIHGMKHKEIAEHMSISLSSVEKYLRTGLAATRSFLRERETNGTGSANAQSKPSVSSAGKK